MTDTEARSLQRDLGEITQSIKGISDRLDHVVRHIEAVTMQGNQTMQHLAALQVMHSEMQKGQTVLFTKVDRLEEQGAGLKTKVAGIAALIGGALSWIATNAKIGN